MAAAKHHKQQISEGRAFAVAKCAMDHMCQGEWDSSQSQGTRKPEVPCVFGVEEKW